MATATKKKKKSGMKLQPLGDRIVVQRDESLDTTAGGIVLPSAAQDAPARGVVLAIGDGRLLENGERSVLQLVIGDHVIFSSYAGEKFKMGDDEYLLMSEADVVAVIE
jgi:chaperonin GroES